MPITPGDLDSLTDEQAYVVMVMRREGAQIKQHRPNEQIIWCGNVAVCTWPTLFSLLGREILKPDDTTGGFALAAAWAKP